MRMVAADTEAMADDRTIGPGTTYSSPNSPMTAMYFELTILMAEINCARFEPFTWILFLRHVAWSPVSVI